MVGVLSMHSNSLRHLGPMTLLSLVAARSATLGFGRCKPALLSIDGLDYEHTKAIDNEYIAPCWLNKSLDG